MMLGIMLAAAGVVTSNVTYLPVVTGYAKCVVFEVGSVGGGGAERDAALDAAFKTCRARNDEGYAAGNFKINGKPFPKQWWKQVQALFDVEDADIRNVVQSAPIGQKFKVMWKLSNGKVVDVGTFVPGMVEVLTVAA